MTKHKFILGQQGDLKARFDAANRRARHAMQQARDLAAQLEAELYLARLFGDGVGIRPQ